MIETNVVSTCNAKIISNNFEFVRREIFIPVLNVGGTFGRRKTGNPRMDFFSSFIHITTALLLYKVNWLLYTFEHNLCLGRLGRSVNVIIRFTTAFLYVQSRYFLILSMCSYITCIILYGVYSFSFPKSFEFSRRLPTDTKRPITYKVIIQYDKIDLDDRRPRRIGKKINQDINNNNNYFLFF